MKTRLTTDEAVEKVRIYRRDTGFVRGLGVGRIHSWRKGIRLSDIKQFLTQHETYVESMRQSKLEGMECSVVSISELSTIDLVELLK